MATSTRNTIRTLHYVVIPISVPLFLLLIPNALLFVQPSAPSKNFVSFEIKDQSTGGDLAAVFMANDYKQYFDLPVVKVPKIKQEGQHASNWMQHIPDDPPYLMIKEGEEPGMSFNDLFYQVKRQYSITPWLANNFLQIRSKA